MPKKLEPVLSKLIASWRDVAQVQGDYTAQRQSRVRWVHEQIHRCDRIRRPPPFARHLFTRFLANKVYRANYAPRVEAL